MHQRLHEVFGVWTGEADAGQLSPRNTIDMVACRRGMLPECQVHELIFLEDPQRNLSHMRHCCFVCSAISLSTPLPMLNDLSQVGANR